MSPEEKARLVIDEQLKQSGWIIQDMKDLNLAAGRGVAVREYPTSSGEVDYALFVDGVPVGIAEAKREEKGEDITTVEKQSARYAKSTFKWMKGDVSIRFAYECTGELTRFTDYKDINYRSRDIFSFHRPESLAHMLKQNDTIRNNMKHFPEFDEDGFRKCQIKALKKLDESFSESRPRALVQMATGAGKTVTAITAAYRLLKYAKVNRILFLVDTKSLGEQAEREFLAYIPNDDHIFAKTDSHADDIIQIVRDEFGMGNEFCQKITYGADNPEAALSSFRNDYNPRIAVTVDMIATGTDVKPIECLVFMRDVRSKNYFEQMKGRGTRTLSKDELQKVTPSATENKDHFVIVDAVGVTKSKKTETRTLERKPTVSMKELMMNVALGARDEDTLTSLANRIIRLNSQMTPAEKKEFEKQVGIPVGKISENLLNAFDEDAIADKAGYIISDDGGEPSEEDTKKLTEAQKELIKIAIEPFNKPEVRNYIENVRRSHEQIIDNVNVDSVVFAGFDTDQEKNADRVIHTFQEFIEENKDEILALRIIYDQKYKKRPMAIEQMKVLYEKLKTKGITVDRLWDCYAIKKPDKVKRGTMAQIADLISIIRFEMGYEDKLSPFADKVNYNFMRWTLKKNAGDVHFTEEQMEWLRLIKEHIAISLSIMPDDLDLSPFDAKGGLGKFYDVFGDEYESVLQEMNEELVA